MLIIKKLNNELRVCVNYKTLNKLIIKNRNAFFFLIKNTLVKLCFVKYFNKFDIIAIFNEIQMRYNDKKAAFFIKYDFFEYVIMLFELCNAFKTF